MDALSKEMLKNDIYRVLRDYQDGKLKEGCERAGQLDVPLTNVLDKIYSLLFGEKVKWF